MSLLDPNLSGEHYLLIDRIECVVTITECSSETKISTANRLNRDPCQRGERSKLGGDPSSDS